MKNTHVCEFPIFVPMCVTCALKALGCFVRLEKQLQRDTRDDTRNLCVCGWFFVRLEKRGY